MSVIITAPSAGSLKITNSSASPQSSYLCNLESTIVSGDPFYNTINIANSNQQNIYSVSLNKLTTVGPSGAGSFTLQNAVDAISSLIIH